MTERVSVQPVNDSAERAVIGCIFSNNASMDTVLEQLSYTDFYAPKHQMIFIAMQSLSARAEPIDYQTLEEELRRNGVLDKIGGMDYLFQLMQEPFYIANLESYLSIVKEKSTLRTLLRLGNDLSARAVSEQESAGSILESFETALLQINEKRLAGGLERIEQTLGETIQRITARSLSEGRLTGLTTGFRDLDQRLSGLQKSDLILLAARPSMGKTALGVNIAYNAAQVQDAEGNYSNQVAIFSLEMSKNQLNQRMLAMATGFDLQDILAGQIEDWDRLFAGVDRLKKLPIYVDDTSSISIQELRSKCRRMKMERGVDLIVIDYLQLMTVEDLRRNENRQQEIATISRGLKALAKEMDCPVLALSQLSRKAESRESARPMMSDMRESGAIEQDADVVMLLYREDYYRKEEEETPPSDLTEVIIAKHRNGPTGTVKLKFIKELTKFGDVTYVDPTP